MKSITRREAIKRGSRFMLGMAAGTLCPTLMSGCSRQEVDAETVAHLARNAQKAKSDELRLTVVYDNVPHDQRLRTDWGFCCLIEGLDRTLLFDAGRYDSILMPNLHRLGIDPQRIDEVFISHDHPDHVGAVLDLTALRPGINVTLGGSFSEGFTRLVKSSGASVTVVDQPCRVSGSCLSTGEMKSFVKNEQALVILTDRGSIVLTGCAHPGVVEIVERARMIAKQDILLLIGGFHLLMDDAASIRKKAARLEALEVRYVAPTHCSGGEARTLFADRFGDRFIQSGVGRVLGVGQLL